MKPTGNPFSGSSLVLCFFLLNEPQPRLGSPRPRAARPGPGRRSLRRAGCGSPEPPGVSEGFGLQCPFSFCFPLRTNVKRVPSLQTQTHKHTVTQTHGHRLSPDAVTGVQCRMESDTPNWCFGCLVSLETRAKKSSQKHKGLSPEKLPCGLPLFSLSLPLVFFVCLKRVLQF